MKVKKFYSKITVTFLALIVLSFVIFLSSSDGVFSKAKVVQSNCCTSILVGKKASIDGSTITTHAADCHICDFTFHYIPAADHKKGETRKIYSIGQYDTWPPETGGKWEMVYKEKYTGVEIPQVPHTNAYIQGNFGYLNEHQLAMGESSVGCREEMRNPGGVMNITELTLLAMERCKKAREAIQLMGSLAEKYGYGLDSGEMLAVADPEEVWLFEIMPVGPLWTPESGKPGALWCAQRVPDDQVAVCPNENQIGKIDLNDPDNFMASSNVISYAVDKGWFDPESGEPFNWKKTYAPWKKSYENHRLWRAFDLLAPSLNLDPDTPNDEFPFSVKPDKKVTIPDLINIHRDRYQGTKFDLTEGIAAGPFSNPNRNRPLTWEVDGKTYGFPRPICLGHCESTTITQSRSWLPNPIGGIVWIGLGVTDTSCFVPFYSGITKLPKSFTIGDHWEFNREAARWAFDYVDFHSRVKFSYAINDIREAQKKWEGEAFHKQNEIDQKALEFYEENPQKAIEFLTDYCIDHANRVVKAWWNLGDDLLVKYNQGYIYTKDRKVKEVGYPENWLRLFIEKDNMKPIVSKKSEK